MEIIKLHLFDSTPFFDTPYQLLGWVGWFVFAAVILWVIRQNMDQPRVKNFWRIFLVMGLAAVFFSLFFGIELPFEEVIPLPNMPSENAIPTLMIFSMLPALAAGGILGVWPAAVLGFISGLISALMNTHSVFTPLETTALVVLLALLLRQDYRTPFFTFLRRPIGAALVVILFSIPIFLISTFFSTNGSMAAKLDYAFTRSWILIVINGLQLLIAGIVCELFKIHRSDLWVKPASLHPSPIETGLQNRILYTTVPMVLVLLLTLVIADWIVAGKAAREILIDQLENSSQIAAENIPSILETGQSLTTALVDLDLPLNNSEKLQKLLRAKVRELPFFNQIFVFDLTGAPITGYPTNDFSTFRISMEEESGIMLALNGVQMQHYIVQPNPGGESALISFVASIPDEYGLARGVIVARTDFAINLFSQPALLALRHLAESGGQGAILNETNQILYHTNPNLVMTDYTGRIPGETGYFEDSGTIGTRYMNYATIDEENGWKVILSMPASNSQDLALRIAIPLLAISLAISILAFLLLRFLMRTLTTSLVHLADRADEISKGELHSQIEVKGVDEIGRLGAAFERMRISLKSRLEELDTLLKVSQGVASDLNLESSSIHLLNALLSYGADAASLVLLRSNLSRGTDDLQSFRVGDTADLYQYLDTVLLDQVIEEKTLIIPSKGRIRRMELPRGVEIPSALAAILLKSDGQETAYIWVAYSQPHRFSEGEVRFLNTLAGQAVLAVSNSILYRKAEVGKKRLESVLTSTPEPVLVAGEAGELLIVNQAAEKLYELISINPEPGESGGEITSKLLKDFVLGTSQTESKVEEIALEDGKTYLVSVSPVEVEGQYVGKVCVLRDVTEYKQLEKMKNEYVSTVSHDLRAPLSLIRGYVSMLPMVGDMNQQQKDYTTKIMEGIDDITGMADDLLDMRRIDSGALLNVEKVSPSEMFNTVVAEMQPQIMNRKIQIMPELTLSQDLTIEADKVLLQRALINLLENAVKYSPVGGQINLRLQVNQDSVVFVIQDHGAGIAPLDLKNLNNWFSRTINVDGNVQRESGLGLSIVKSIAERHQGKVWAESQLGKGSTFLLEIPLRYALKSKNL